jgi:tetratricopeptide (TPR) repeat protein
MIQPILKMKTMLNGLRRALTPALSHPMGEGESFSGFLECRAVEIAEQPSANQRLPIAVPSPIGWERVRVRAILFSFTLPLILASALSVTAKEKKSSETTGAAQTTFASVATNHALASTWNDPDFQRRLIGSYGFASDAEPRMTPEEQATYREKVVPLLREDPKKAIAMLEGLAKPGASAVFDFTLGNVYFQNEDLTNAVKHFEAALAKFPDCRRAQQNLGFALMRDGKYADAIKPLTRTISLGVADGRVFGLLGFAYMDQGRFASAEAAYRQALVFEPENLEFKLGVVKCAVSLENYGYALTLLDELIKLHPERDALWTLQANIYIQKEQPAKAAVSLEMLRRLGKTTPQNLFLLGDLYMTQEARDLALGAYLEAIEKDGGQNPAKALRPAQILVSRGAWTEARQLFAKMRGAGSGLTGADELKLLKLESKVAMSTGEGEKAIQTLEQIIQKDPLEGEALLLAGDYYARNGQPEKAEFRYETAAKLDGFQADAYLKRAQLLVQSQKYALAVEFLNKAQKVKPRDNVQRYLEKVEQLARAGRS